MRNFLDDKFAIHDVGAPALKGGVVPGEKLIDLAKRIRNTGGPQPGHDGHWHCGQHRGQLHP